MRLIVASVAAIVFGLSGCAVSRSSPRPVWQTGFWLWQSDHAIPPWRGDPLDVIFVQAGSIGNLPQAREYWLVFRYGQQGMPGPEFAAEIGRAVADARPKLQVAGIQLDVDCPTARLHDYARL